MKSMLSIIIAVLTLCNSLIANSRTNELIPGLAVEFNIEPMIPENYVAMAPSGNPDPYDWIYWGPKDVLEKYFKDENSLNVPIIRTKLSANVAQTGPNTFSDDQFKPMIEQQSKKDPKGFSYNEYFWGKYPVHASLMTMMGTKVYMAHVGLNAEGNWVMLFNLVLPKRPNGPTAEDVAFWNNFLEKTKG